ncbi:hypothetical protein [Demequina sp. NBRC 110056]|uniref:hypothetical protein n=1 Tax=Demequina sp. NBRC 110056 TaxID=1570345 RepID=UPI000A0582B9|nr:hypothetical protein [Demequina sp. NBRC 110056]
MTDDKGSGTADAEHEMDDDATRVSPRPEAAATPESAEDDDRTRVVSRDGVAPSGAAEATDTSGGTDTAGGTGGDTRDLTLVSARRAGKHALTLPGSGHGRTRQDALVVDSFAPPADGAVPSRVIASYPPREIPPPPPAPEAVEDGPAPTRSAQSLPSEAARSRRGARRTLAVFTVSCALAAGAAVALVVIWL